MLPQRASQPTISPPPREPTAARRRLGDARHPPRGRPRGAHADRVLQDALDGLHWGAAQAGGSRDEAGPCDLPTPVGGAGLKILAGTGAVTSMRRRWEMWRPGRSPGLRELLACSALAAVECRPRGLSADPRALFGSGCRTLVGAPGPAPDLAGWSLGDVRRSHPLRHRSASHLPRSFASQPQDSAGTGRRPRPIGPNNRTWRDASTSRGLRARCPPPLRQRTRCRKGIATRSPSERRTAGARCPGDRRGGSALAPRPRLQPADVRLTQDRVLVRSQGWRRPCVMH